MPRIMGLTAGTRIQMHVNGDLRNLVILEKIEGGDALVTTYDSPQIIGAKRVDANMTVDTVPHEDAHDMVRLLGGLPLGTPFRIRGNQPMSTTVYVATDRDEKYVYTFLLGDANTMYRLPFELSVVVTLEGCCYVIQDAR